MHVGGIRSVRALTVVPAARHGIESERATSELRRAFGGSDTNVIYTVEISSAAAHAEA